MSEKDNDGFCIYDPNSFLKLANLVGEIILIKQYNGKEFECILRGLNVDEEMWFIVYGLKNGEHRVMDLDDIRGFDYA